MLSTALNSERAIDVNIAIMRAFVRLRELVSSHKDLARRPDELEKKVGHQDEKIQAVFEAAQFDQAGCLSVQSPSRSAVM